MRSSFNLQGSHGVSPANDSKQDDHDGDHQKNVNETAYGVGGDQPQKPQDEQNNSDRIEHGIYLFKLQDRVPRHENFKPG
jgi:hypothetical protein